MGEGSGAVEELVMPLESFANLKGRRILVTGHTGFKGSWLLNLAGQLGLETYGLALHPTHPQAHEAIASQWKAAHEDRNYIGNIRDIAFVKDVVREVSPHVVIHMAAQALVQGSYHAPYETFDTNVGGVANIIESVISSETVLKCAILIVTSDKVYENRNDGRAFGEGDPLHGKDPYSASKSAAEMVVTGYQSVLHHRDQSDDFPITTARAGNVIGGGDYASNRLIPDVYRALSDGRGVELRQPNQVRPWQHVLEPLFGYLLLANTLAAGENNASPFNFGPILDDCVSVETVLKKLAEINPEISYALADPTAAAYGKESKLLRLSIEKARSELNWQPSLRLDDALALTNAWYGCSIKGGGHKDLAELSDKQVLKYLESKS